MTCFAPRLAPLPPDADDVGFVFTVARAGAPSPSTVAVVVVVVVVVAPIAIAVVVRRPRRALAVTPRGAVVCRIFKRADGGDGDGVPH